MTFISRTARALAFSILLTAPVAGCGDQDQPDNPDAGQSTLIAAFDVPIDGLSAADVGAFSDGDDTFDLVFRPADGLGPLYIRDACGNCHDRAARGPGLVQKMSVVDADGVTTSADQSALPWGHTERPFMTSGAVTPILPPPGNPNVKVSVRVGPPVLGRGYMEAIADSEIMRVQTEQSTRQDGIHGHVNTVMYASVAATDGFSSYHQGDTAIGRFGLKARVATLDDFTADAFQGDMGLTTPMRPTEVPNPDGLTDDTKPGVDLDIDHVNRIAFYMRRIAIPKRVNLSAQGATLFDQAKCSVCHVPSLKTRADYPIPELANIDSPVYTDLLLHDMGNALADGMVDQSATSKEWRTAPLIGIRFIKTFMHDGRVSNIADAIGAHAGEAQVAVDAFNALSAADQQTLITFVEAL